MSEQPVCRLFLEPIRQCWHKDANTATWWQITPHISKLHAWFQIRKISWSGLIWRPVNSVWTGYHVETWHLWNISMHFYNCVPWISPNGLTAHHLTVFSAEALVPLTRWPDDRLQVPELTLDVCIRFSCTHIPWGWLPSRVCVSVCLCVWAVHINECESGG